MQQLSTLTWPVTNNSKDKIRSWRKWQTRALMIFVFDEFSVCLTAYLSKAITTLAPCRNRSCLRYSTLILFTQLSVVIPFLLKRQRPFSQREENSGFHTKVKLIDSIKIVHTVYFYSPAVLSVHTCLFRT